MTEKPTTPETSPLINPLAVFAEPLRRLTQCQDECIVVIDTNVLLLPYKVGNTSLNDIVAKYKKLADKKQLAIPAQVAVEFAKNRPQKVADIIQSLSNIHSKNINDDDFPVLTSTPEYAEYVKKRDALKQPMKEYHEALSKVIEKIRDWEWDDPVASAYRGVLKDCVVPLTQSTEKLEDEHKKRFARKIPPGYKDASKDDGGIGDFLIWKGILQIGAERKAPLIFVTGDEKADWSHRVNNKPFLPRCELVDEYRTASGKEFFLLSFVDFLRLFHAKQETITQVQQFASVDDDVLSRFLNDKVSRINLLSIRFGRAREQKNIEEGIATLKQLSIEVKGLGFPDLAELKYELSVLIQTAEQRGFDGENFTKREFWSVGRSLLRQARGIVRQLP